MSAYIVDLDHIAYLVQAGTARALGMDHSTLSWVWNIDREAGTYDRETLRCGDLEQNQRVGQMLCDENAKSVAFRYPNHAIVALKYSHSVPPFARFDPVQVIKACDCYEYQSCEHTGWLTSEARAYIDALRSLAWTSLPGYDDAAWGAPARKPDVDFTRPSPEREAVVDGLLADLGKDGAV